MPRVGPLCFCGHFGRAILLVYRTGARFALLNEGRQGGAAIDLVVVAPVHLHRGSFFFSGSKGDQAQQGTVIVRTRDNAWGTRSGVGAGGGAVALLVKLLSRYPTSPERAPPCRHIGMVTTLERGGTPRPSGQFARW